MLKKHKVQMKFEAPAVALERWNKAIKSAASDDETTLNIYDVIGENWDGTGMTAKYVSAFLRRADSRDITVNINSPGGDFFEGIAINTLLQQYEGNVCVKVIGMAASAASVIAMAGDEIQIAAGAFIMIHNSWTIALGNRNDMTQIADMLGKFDSSMVALYSDKTGISEDEIAKMMDVDTWIKGKDAVEQGFADSILGDSDIDIDKEEDSAYNSSLRKADVMLAKAGMTRSERRELFQELKGTPSAAENVTPSADEIETSKRILALLEDFNKTHEV